MFLTGFLHYLCVVASLAATLAIAFAASLHRDVVQVVLLAVWMAAVYVSARRYKRQFGLSPFRSGGRDLPDLFRFSFGAALAWTPFLLFAMGRPLLDSPALLLVVGLPLVYLVAAVQVVAMMLIASLVVPAPHPRG